MSVLKLQGYIYSHDHVLITLAAGAGAARIYRMQDINANEAGMIGN